MKKIRTIKAAYEEILSVDPDTCITLRAIRRAVSEGDIPSIRMGVKYLVCLDEVTDYFSGGKNDDHQSKETCI